MPANTVAASGRLALLDQIRGLTLLAMIAYHAMWDLVYLFGVQIPWFRTEAAFWWQQSICWTFIMLSGFCWPMGRQQHKRGLVVLGGAVIISAVTIVLMPYSAVRFGVLCLIGSGMLALIPLDGLLKKVEPWVGLVVSFLLFAVTRFAKDGTVGFFSISLVNLPQGWYRNLLTAYLGFPGKDFFSTDYFPVIPWLFLYLAGYFLFGVFRKAGLLQYLRKGPVRPLEFLGRHSLPIYMIHQPVVYGLLWLLLGR